MNIQQIVTSKPFKNFMSKLYGWGATVVILGALFKIQHWPGAGIMLTAGLGTEAFIFFMSAFEPPHAEPDWSLVYPELAGMYDLEGDDHGHGGGGAAKKSKSATEELDSMLKEANVGPEMFERLGEGLKNLTDNTLKMTDITQASVATGEYVANIKTVSSSVSELGQGYKAAAESLTKDVAASEEYVGNLKMAADASQKLATSYNSASEVLKSDITATEEYITNIKHAANSAQALAIKYDESCAALAQTAENLSIGKIDEGQYKDKLQEVAKNLGALNAVYELQLQSSSSQIELNQKLQNNMEQFIANLNSSIESTVKYKEESDVLVKNVAALNNVYGNMLSAMNVTVQR